MGLLGWAGYALMIYVGANEVPANTTGAFVAALASTLLIRRTSIPGFGLVSAALLPLVPGLALYNGLLQVVGTPSETANPSAGGSTLLLALGVAGPGCGRHSRDVSRTPDRGPASPYPTTPPSRPIHLECRTPEIGERRCRFMTWALSRPAASSP